MIFRSCRCDCVVPDWEVKHRKTGSKRAFLANFQTSLCGDNLAKYLIFSHLINNLCAVYGLNLVPPLEVKKIIDIERVGALYFHCVVILSFFRLVFSAKK